jgi:hypothetical protein
VRRALRLSWQSFKDGKKHLRCDCLVCGAHVRFLTPDPWDNPDVEIRAR